MCPSTHQEEDAHEDRNLGSHAVLRLRIGSVAKLIEWSRTVAVGLPRQACRDRRKPACDAARLREGLSIADQPALQSRRKASTARSRNRLAGLPGRAQYLI